MCVAVMFGSNFVITHLFISLVYVFSDVNHANSGSFLMGQNMNRSKFRVTYLCEDRP